ncbi:MAG: lipocalin family protein [Prolixibacteraceae bacterium]
MKTLILICLCLATWIVSNAQVNDLNGEWNLIEFSTDTENGNEQMNEEKLKGDGSVWNLFFLEEAKFRQTSNMSESGTMDTYEGTWKKSGDNLTISILINGQYYDLYYTCKLDGNILTLVRSNPMGTMKITGKFRKKLS